MKTVIVNQPAIILLAVILGTLAAIAYYFKDRKFAGVAKIWIYVMAFLRWLAVFLITVLLAGILVKKISYRYQKPVVVWLQDNSQSIALATDSTELRNFLKNRQKLFDKLKKNYDLRVFNFDKTLYQTGLKQQPAFDGKYTDISGALTGIKNRFYNQNLGAIILASDGIYTLGYNPADITGLEQTPVYTVLLGDTTQHTDLKISSVLTNKIAYLGNEFPVYIEVQATKAAGTKSVLEIVMDGKVVKKQPIDIKSNSFFDKYTFYIKAARPGKKIISIRLKPVENEPNKRNNFASAIIDIVDTRQKILILSNFPHPDIAALKRALEKNRTLDVKFKYTDKFDGKVNGYNLIILYQIPTLDKNNDKLLSQIAQAQIPVLFVCGTRCDYEKLSELSTGLIIKPVPGEFDEAQPVLNEAFDLFITDRQLKPLLPGFPPLIVPFGEIRTTAQGQTLLKQKVKGIPTGNPLIIIFPQSPYNNTNVSVILGEGLWRWRMSEYKMHQNFEQFDKLTGQLVQFTANKKQRKRFVVQVPQVVTQGDDIIFTAQLFDKSFQPVTAPDVKLQITDTSGKTYDYLMDKKQDYYILNIGTLTQGVYKYKATTSLGGENFIQTGSFAVKSENIEALDLQAKKDLMEYLAAKSGGKMLLSNNLEQLETLLKENQSIKPLQISETSLQELIANKWLFAVILLSLTAEWILRKYFGNM